MTTRKPGQPQKKKVAAKKKAPPKESPIRKKATSAKKGAAAKKAGQSDQARIAATKVAAASKSRAKPRGVGDWGTGYLDVQGGVVGIQFPSEFVSLQAIATADPNAVIGLVIALGPGERTITVEALAKLGAFLELQVKQKIVVFGVCTHG